MDGGFSVDGFEDDRNVLQDGGQTTPPPSSSLSESEMMVVGHDDNNNNNNGNTLDHKEEKDEERASSVEKIDFGRVAARDVAQMRGLLLKQITLQTRQKKTLGCQICFPIVLLLLTYSIILLTILGISALIDSVGGGGGGGGEIVTPAPVDILHDAIFPYYRGEIGRYDPPGADDIPNKVLVAVGDDVLLDDRMRAEIGVLSERGSNHSYGLMSHMEQVKTAPFRTELEYVPRSLAVGRLSNGVDRDINGYLYKHGSGYGVLGGMTINKLDRSKRQASINVHYDHTCDSMSAALWYLSGPKMLSSELCKLVSRSSIMSLATNAITNFLFPEAKLLISTSLQHMPYREITFNLDQFRGILDVIAASPFGIVLLFPLPLMLYSIVLEKVNRIREMMKLNGLIMRNYWIVTIGFNALLYTFTILLIIVSAAIAQFKFVLQSNFLLLLLFFILSCLSVISFAIFLSSLLNGTLKASLLGYVIALGAPYLYNQIGILVMQRPLLASVLLLFPPFAMQHTLSLGFIIPCAAGNCPGLASVSNEFAGIGMGLTFMVINIIMCFSLGWYIDQIMPGKWGIRRHPLFFISSIFRLVKRIFDRGNKRVVDQELGEEAERESLLDEDGEGANVNDAHFIDMDDDDVRRERSRVQRLLLPKNAQERKQFPTVVLKNLSKKFGAKIAVNDVNLALRRGETFGLLGPNAAGKTTTLNVITGLLAPSSGTVYVSGYDIRTDLSIVRQSMGFCPQFEVVWPELTVREHLLFYARIKGVLRDKESQHVMDIMEQVDLANLEGNSKAHQLSGGMKKRLGIAMSLVGDPSLVLMDEMTTGLDVYTKRSIHEVLMRNKKGRTFMLTTHSLEEADLLCDRLAIIAQGKLQCVGEPHYLKSKFGGGYRITVAFTEDNRGHVERFMESLMPEARIANIFAGSTTFVVSKGADIGGLLAEIEQRREESRIVDYTISASSLEDVYLKIVEAEEESIN